MAAASLLASLRPLGRSLSSLRNSLRNSSSPVILIGSTGIGSTSPLGLLLGQFDSLRPAYEVDRPLDELAGAEGTRRPGQQLVDGLAEARGDAAQPLQRGG